MKDVTVRVSRGEVKFVRPNGESTTVDSSSEPYTITEDGVRVEFNPDDTDFIITTASLISDLNHDGVVNFGDLLIMKNDFFNR